VAACKKIAPEEHFLAPGFDDYWKTSVTDVDPTVQSKLHGRLTDFGEQRLAAMDSAGITRAVLSISGPGVQIERDAPTAVRKAREANDFLASEIQKRPDRYSGFAHLPMQDVAAAADELERCVKDLKFCGAMINGHTNGQYLDDPKLNPFWERAVALDTLIYLHPTDPVAPLPVLAGYESLSRATWGWGVETGSHALRLIFGGVFDRFPKARLALGHLGETLPFLLWRFDSRAKLYGVKLGKKPIRLYPREHRGDDLRHVFRRATPLHHRRARRRPRAVLSRLSVRVERRGGQVLGHGAARRQGSCGRCAPQCRAGSPPAVQLIPNSS
jgi:2,3-dihydroxybenzoate decarboxylase